MEFEGGGAEPAVPVLHRAGPIARSGHGGACPGRPASAARRPRSCLRPNRNRLLTGASSSGRRKHGVGGDARAAGKRDRVGGIPAGGPHGAHDILLAADQADIDRVAGVAVARQGDARGLSEEGMTAEVANPQRRHDQIGGGCPGQGNQQQALGVQQMQHASGRLAGGLGRGLRGGALLLDQASPRRSTARRAGWSGSASAIWLIGSGGVSTAATTNTPRMAWRR